MARAKRVRFIAARYPAGHVMGQAMVPLMAIRENDYRFFQEHVCRDVEIDEHGMVQDRDLFVKQLNIYKPGIAGAIRQMEPSVQIQIWPEPLCCFQTSPM
jgi:hypothetical protein